MGRLKIWLMLNGAFARGGVPPPLPVDSQARLSSLRYGSPRSLRSGYLQSHSAGSAAIMLFLVLRRGNRGALKEMNSRSSCRGDAPGHFEPVARMHQASWES